MQRLKITLLLSLYVSFQVSAQRTNIPLPVSKNNLIVIAHRGNHLHVPENTIEAVNEAIKAGADYVEIDLRTTLDGHLVLQHDATVDRMTNEKGKVKNLTLKQIKQLKIPGIAANTFFTIPEFKDILNACKSKINIYLDFKDADVAETYKQIKTAGMEKQMVVYLNQEAQYSQWRKIAPGMPLMTSLPDNISNDKGFDTFFTSRPIEVLDNVSDSSLAVAVHKKGVAVWLDVQGKDEGPQVWNSALQKKVQGLQTDHPEALIDYLEKIGLRNRK